MGEDRFGVVVVGGSAGGVEALKRFVSSLPHDLPAAVFVTLHLASGAKSLLPGILARGAAIRVVPAVDGAPVETATVYVAQPDTHLVVDGNRVRLGAGARENGHRPSVDVLLRSAAVSSGHRVVGVVLTGMLDDGSAGLRAVARYGGAVFVQHPDDAEFPAMPRNALAAVPQANALPLDQLTEEVVRTVAGYRENTPGARQSVDAAVRRRDELEVRSALGEPPILPDGTPLGTPSGYSCPDCGGVLNEVEDTQLVRFRCRVGHAWSGDSLLRQQGETIEDALWTALRALEERQDVANRLAAESGKTGREWSSRFFRTRAEGAARAASLLRELLSKHHEAEDEPDGVAAAL
jgi:two-component system chemotaxis response regulator CheB